MYWLGWMQGGCVLAEQTLDRLLPYRQRSRAAALQRAIARLSSGIARDKATLTVVITGAGSGVGKALLHCLERYAVRVVPVIRPQRSRVSSDAPLPAGAVEADLATADGLQNALHGIRSALQKSGHDSHQIILIHCAGVMYLPEKNVAFGGAEEQMAVNAIAPIVLTEELKAEFPIDRVVFLASHAHRSGRIKDAVSLLHAAGSSYDPLAAYASSKLVVLAYALAAAQADPGKVVAVHPGVVRTNLWRHIGGALGLLVSASGPLQISPDRAAEAVLIAALDPEAPSRSPFPYIDENGLAARVSSRAYDCSVGNWFTTAAAVLGRARVAPHAQSKLLDFAASLR